MILRLLLFLLLNAAVYGQGLIVNPYVFAGSTLNNNLLVYYKLEEGTGVTREDATASNNDLTDNGSVPNAAGQIGNAANLDGSDDFLNNTGTWGNQSGDLTVAAWVNADTLGDGGGYGRGIVAYTSSDAVGDWIISIGDTGANGRVSFYHWESAGVDADGRHKTTDDIVTTGSWFHIVARRSSGTYTIWVNGVSKSFSNASTDSSWGVNRFQVGQIFPTSGYRWDGKIDEVAMWTRGLTDGEIAELYASGSGKTCCPF